MGGLEGAVHVAGVDVVGCPGVGGVGSLAAEVAGDGGCADVRGFAFVSRSVEGGSFVDFAVHGADVESAAVEAGDWEASGFTGVAAAHVAPSRGSCRCLLARRVRGSDRR